MDAKKIEEVPFEEVYEVEKYGTYYSENKFWQKVQRVAKKVGATVIRPVFHSLDRLSCHFSGCFDDFFYSKSNTISKIEDVAFITFH